MDECESNPRAFGLVARCQCLEHFENALVKFWMDARTVILDVELQGVGTFIYHRVHFDMTILFIVVLDRVVDEISQDLLELRLRGRDRDGGGVVGDDKSHLW